MTTTQILTAYDTFGKAKAAQSSMVTTRYFEVKVRSCSECPFADNADGLDCLHDFKTQAIASNRWIENVQGITPTCPMWDETKESKAK